ncbi:hypothetical protein B0J13DRAFT_442618, partial [Dactylonectria estremocensis]
FEWTFVVLAFASVSARLYVRIWMRRDRLYWSDVWLVTAMAAAFGLVTCDTLTYRMNAMDNFTVTGVSLHKIRFATNYLFDVAMYLPKLSIIAFYYNLVPSSNPRMRMALHVLATITGACGLSTLFIVTFWCGPNPSVSWSEVEDLCASFNSMIVMRVNWSMNFTTEVLNFFFPFPLIRGLNIRSRREKISLGAIFAMGIITIAISVGRFVRMLYVSNDITIYIWATCELCISIMIVGLTALRPLLRKIAHKLSSIFAGSDTGFSHKILSREHQTWTKTKSARPGEGSYLRNADTSFQSRVVATRNDSTGSKAELNETESGKITKKEELFIVSRANRDLNAVAFQKTR